MNIEFMKKAIELSRENGKNNYTDGGPFGAVIVDEKGNIIGEGKNSVLINHDATAHAEICAIREASKKLGTHNLENCTLYTSCYPCPMCLSAIIWANIKTVYYGCEKEDAEEIGFRDKFIYDFINGNQTDCITLNQMEREKAVKVFEEYKNCEGKEKY